MSKYTNPILNDLSLKSGAIAVRIVSNLFHTIFKTIRFVLNHPLNKAITLGLSTQVLASHANILQNGMTPLHREAEIGNFHRVQALVKEGANIYAEDNNGQTPLDLVCSILQVQSSVENDDDLVCIPNIEDHLSAHRDYISIVNYLTSKGARSFCTVFNPAEEELVTIEEEITTQNLKP